MSLAVVSIPVVTPVHAEPTPESVAERLRDMAQIAPAIARAVTALAEHGWAMVKPEAVPDGEDGEYVDVLIAFTKDFPDAAAAEREARECVPAERGRFNADLGWNANPAHPEGPTHYEAVEWWTSL
jgi:hypothetical protein